MLQFPDRIQLNGVPASAADLALLVRTNYGHFTAMQARDGAVRGLDLHLHRLDQASRELFGTALAAERVRGYLRLALAGDRQPLSIRVNVFSRALNRNELNASVPVDVLVIAGPATSTRVTPLRLKSFCYARDLAAIKHVGTFPLFHFRKLAQQAGFDDAVFVDEVGRISEGSIWNIGFADAQGVIWPDAPQLHGVSLQLLQQGLIRQGASSTTKAIHLSDLPSVRSAFFSNASVPARPIASIDEVQFRVDEALISQLLRAYESNPGQAI
jgi:branched-subunit amino acid aminotransferase/4-amino-4-deoxychorismate lyase